MTGYGAATYSSKSIELNIGIKSVNGRYLESRFHLPKEYNEFEPEFKKQLKKTFRRGNFDIFIHRRRREDTGVYNVEPHLGLARDWIKSYKEIGKALKLKGDPDLNMLVQIPGVILINEKKTVTAEEKKSIFTQFEKAIQACEKERVREGAALKKELTQFFKELTDCTQIFVSLRGEANQALAKKLKARLKSLGASVPVDAQRFSQEVSYLLERSDIGEEITRLKEHVRSCQKLLLAKESIGKKLDFYCQELLREVNTIGSKSQITELTGQVVNAKAIIEKIREQVQNIE